MRKLLPFVAIWVISIGTLIWEGYRVPAIEYVPVPSMRRSVIVIQTKDWVMDNDFEGPVIIDHATNLTSTNNVFFKNVLKVDSSDNRGTIGVGTVLTDEDLKTEGRPKCCDNCGGSEFSTAGLIWFYDSSPHSFCDGHKWRPISAIVNWKPGLLKVK